MSFPHTGPELCLYSASLALYRQAALCLFHHLTWRTYDLFKKWVPTSSLYLCKIVFCISTKQGADWQSIQSKACSEIGVTGRGVQGRLNIQMALLHVSGRTSAPERYLFDILNHFLKFYDQKSQVQSSHWRHLCLRSRQYF